MRRLLLSSSRVVFHTTVGVVLLVAGIVMLVTPGPGIVTVVLGLAVLAREFDWAERLQRATLRQVRDASTHARARLAAHRATRAGTVTGAGAPPSVPPGTGPSPADGSGSDAEDWMRPAS